MILIMIVYRCHQIYRTRYDPTHLVDEIDPCHGNAVIQIEDVKVRQDRIAENDDHKQRIRDESPLMYRYAPNYVLGIITSLETDDEAVQTLNKPQMQRNAIHEI